jgi:hypothetical protein
MPKETQCIPEVLRKKTSKDFEKRVCFLNSRMSLAIFDKVLDKNKIFQIYEKIFFRHSSSMSDQYVALKAHNYWVQLLPDTGFNGENYLNFIKKLLNLFSIQKEYQPKQTINYTHKESIGDEFIQYYKKVQSTTEQHQKTMNLKGKMSLVMPQPTRC